MKFKLLLIFLIIYSLFVFAIDQDVIVEVNVVANMFLGDDLGGDDLIDNDGHVFASLSNNEASDCMINWEGVNESIGSSLDSANYFYISSGLKTVQYYCKLDEGDFVNATYVINVLDVPPFLQVEPSEPNGNEGWYIFEPNFTLVPNESATSTHYRWDGSGELDYTIPFNLTDLPNPPKKSAGILVLKYWSNYNGVLGDIKEATFKIDLTSPDIKDVFPVNNSITQDNDIIISAVLDEKYGGNSGIDLTKITFLLDGFNTEFTIDQLTPQKVRINSDVVNLTQGLHTVTVTAEDIAGNPISQYNWEFTVEYRPFEFYVYSPVDGVYNYNRFKFNVSTNRDVDIQLSDNAGEFKNLCTSCTSYTRTKTFTEGQHDLVIKAISGETVLDYKNVSLFIDSAEPRISSINPKNKTWVNGSIFSVKYTDDYLEKITFNYKGEDETEFTQIVVEGCESGRSKECEYDADLSEYDRQDVVWYFEVSDKISSDKSREQVVYVDNTKPDIDFDLEEGVYGDRRINLDIGVDEIVELSYTDNDGRENRLCSNCEGYDRSKSFKDGEHLVKIIGVDRAGNSKTVQKNIVIDSKTPKIRSVLPKSRSYANGEFIVIYEEDNVELVTLEYSQGDITTTFSKEDCPSGKTSCVFNVEGLEQGDLSFRFIVKDNVHEDTSKFVDVVVDTVDPILSVELPEDDSDVDRRVQFDISVSEEITLEYKDDSEVRPRYKKLCSRCDEYIKPKTFNDGLRKVTIKATDNAGNFDEEYVEFTVDSKKPRIRSTLPKTRSVINESLFSVEFIEDNVKEVLFKYNGETETEFSSLVVDDCDDGVCSIEPDLNYLDGQDVESYFTVSDFVRSVDSRVSEVSLDFTSPELILRSPDDGIYGDNSILIDVGVSEKVKTLSYSINGERFRSLCSNCDSYNRTKRFNVGEVDLVLQALDYAGNYDEIEIGFSVV